MSLFRATHPPQPEDDAFAETVVEELPHDAAEMIELDGQALDDATLEALPTLGHVGRYVLKHQLGAGGLGTVYAAIDPLLSRPIAVKMLKLDAVQPTQREALEQQLLTEARAAAGLSHPHIVTVYDAGLAESGVYVAMERLQGKDLRQLLAAGWRPTPEQVVRIVKRVADALAYAHTKGVIHCDVKPANVFMVSRSQPKLLDFGIARLVQQGHPDATALAGEQAPELGSPYYAAPEQMRGQALDARVDVYALGLVTYELLTGRRAFGGESLEQIRHAVLHDTVPMADQLNPQVDRELSQIVAKAMARDPDDRHANARHLVRALRRWSDRHETQGEVEALGARKHRPWLWAGVAAGGTALAPRRRWPCSAHGGGCRDASSLRHTGRAGGVRRFGCVGGGRSGLRHRHFISDERGCCVGCRLGCSADARSQRSHEGSGRRQQAGQGAARVARAHGARHHRAGHGRRADRAGRGAAGHQPLGRGRCGRRGQGHHAAAVAPDTRARQTPHHRAQRRVRTFQYYGHRGVGANHHRAAPLRFMKPALRTKDLWHA
jgi:Protein kinase domain